MNKSFEAELRNNAVTPVKTPAGSLTDLIRSVYLDHFKPLYFIFDQFEELFIYGSVEERITFIENVKRIIHKDINCKFIFSLREEYLAHLTEFEETIPDFFSNRTRILRISKHKAKEIIEGQCRKFNINLKEGFADLSLDLLSPGRDEVELTYLQVYLDKMYRIAETDEQDRIIFSTELTNKTGKIKDILGDFLEEQLRKLPDQERGVKVLKSFINPDGKKRPFSLEEVSGHLRDLKTPVDPEELKETVNRFVNLRILKDKDDNDRYELRHDSLAAKISEKLSFTEKELLEVRNYVENQYILYRKRKRLLTSDDLEYIKPYLDRLYFDKKLSEFIRISQIEITRQKRRKRQFILLSTAVLFLVLSAFTVWALIERGRAEESALVSRSNELSAKSLLELEKDPTVSYELVREALNTKQTLSSLEALTLVQDNSAYSPFYTELEGHTDFVYDICYLKNRKLIVTASYDSTVRIWDLEGKNVAILKGHTSSIMSLDFSPDENNLLSAGSDGIPKIWNISNIREFPEIITNYQSLEDSLPHYLAYFSPDGETIVTADLIKSGAIWKYNSGLQTWTLRNRLVGHKSRILSIAFSKWNGLFATSSMDNTARVWNFNGECKAVLEGHGDRVRHVAFSPDGKKIVTSSNDYTARLWDTQGNKLKVLDSHSNDVVRSGFAPDNSFIITISDDNFACIYDPEGNLKIRKEFSEIQRFDISSDSRYIALGSYNGLGSVWTRNGDPLFDLKRHNGPVRDILFIEDDTRILTGSDDHTAKIWNMKDSNLQIIERRISEIIGFNLANETEFAVTRENEKFGLYDTSRDSLIREFDISSSNLKAVFSNDGQLILTTQGNTVRLWNRSGHELRAILHSSIVNSVAFSSDGRYILTTCGDMTVRRWDTNGNLLTTYQEENPGIKAMKYAEFSPDGRHIVAASLNNKAFICDSEGKAYTILTGHKSSLEKACYSPDGKLIITSSIDGEVMIWSDTGESIKVLEKHPTAVSEIRFSKDGSCFLTFSANPGLVRVWSRDGAMLNSIKLTEDTSHRNFVTFTSDNKVTVYTVTDNRLYVKKWPVHMEDLIKSESL